MSAKPAYFPICLIGRIEFKYLQTACVGRCLFLH
nr:MAG TPA: hypothetical protein [Caudoviricetes sp.]